MSTPAQRVHFELMSRLTVRTIPARPRQQLENSSGRHGDTPLLRKRIRKLYAGGLLRYQIANELNISSVTVWRHLSGVRKRSRGPRR
jgi:DNA-binding NarL/FixJ family response regulator